MKKNILIIHYNTPYLTECLVRSINLFVEDAVIYIFDNSTDKPFTAKFDNVTVFDNTKGQIINFDKWLENYPNKKKSGGRDNKWGSAKHCYSIEKCMDLINENFMLLDSDVLLKKDISSLFDDNLLFLGEIGTQINSKKRILPFLCYINVDFCKKNGIHYFDDNYMHGLCKTGEADKYDTGGAFYIATKNYPHKEIKCDDYILHYGHGSWKKIGKKPKYTVDEWLKIYKKFWSNEKNKKVVYTCITGDYDRLIDPKFYSDGFDYICFTNNNKLNSDIWEIRQLPIETEGLSEVKKQRYVKVNPHLILSDYNVSIWIDGNVTIKGDLNKFVNSSLIEDCSVYVPQHPSRNCIYSESKVIVSMRKDKSEITKPQMERYKNEDFPEKYGLLQSNILLRKHNDSGCIKLMECWFEEIKNGSHRDQLSFNYVSWKNKDVKIIYLDKYIYKSEYFLWNGSHAKNNFLENYKKGSKDKKKRIEELKERFYSMINSKKIQTYNVGIYE